MKTNEPIWTNDSPAIKETYDDEKRKKKQRIVRNEFERSGKYGIPLIKKQDIDIDKIEPWCYTKVKADDEENKHKTIHFFTYDWNFETVYDKPEAALEKLDQYYALMTPEFSTYKDMPLARQIDSVFKNRWCGAYWQKQGMRVICPACHGVKHMRNSERIGYGKQAQVPVVQAKAEARQVEEHEDNKTDIQLFS